MESKIRFVKLKSFTVMRYSGKHDFLKPIYEPVDMCKIAGAFWVRDLPDEYAYASLVVSRSFASNQDKEAVSDDWICYEAQTGLYLSATRAPEPDECVEKAIALFEKKGEKNYKEAIRKNNIVNDISKWEDQQIEAKATD